MTDTPTSLSPPAPPLPHQAALRRLVGADSLTRVKRLVGSAGRRTTPADETDGATTPRPRRDARTIRNRCLAFGLLIAGFAAVGIIVASSLGGSQPVAKPAVTVATRPRYWVVRSGQTLVSIAARESITPTSLQQANPSLIATRLTPGQRVRLPN